MKSTNNFVMKQFFRMNQIRSELEFVAKLQPKTPQVLRVEVFSESGKLAKSKKLKVVKFKCKNWKRLNVQIFFAKHFGLHRQWFKPWSQIPLRTSYERFLTIYVMVKKSFVRRSQGYLWPRLQFNFPKSELKFRMTVIWSQRFWRFKVV